MSYDGGVFQGVASRSTKFNKIQETSKTITDAQFNQEHHYQNCYTKFPVKPISKTLTFCFDDQVSETESKLKKNPSHVDNLYESRKSHYITFIK